MVYGFCWQGNSTVVYRVGFRQVHIIVHVILIHAAIHSQIAQFRSPTTLRLGNALHISPD